MMRWAILALAMAGCSVAKRPAAPPPLQTSVSEAVIAIHSLAERFYLVGDYEVSLVECKRMLQLDPYYAPGEALLEHARYLLTKTEGVSATVRLAQVESWLEAGRSQLLFGDLDLAEQYAQLAFDTAPLLPPEMDVELRMTQARAILDWVQIFRDD